MYVLIQLKDMCYYDDDFEYDPILINASGEDFEQKYEGLVNIAQDYNDFQEVLDYINENFTEINFEKRVIKI